MSWDEGYISQIEYVHGYYRELNPLMLELALLANGHQPRQKRPLRYLELGFGQGLSLNIHAAACDGEFWGNDFNPSHTANAKNMALASGANLKVLDDSFAQLASRTDLPEFDVIALHGVWSWVSTENRNIILDLVRSKLALGGTLYISYNTTPGWSSIIPVRDLMMMHVDNISLPGDGISKKIDDALAFTEQLIDAGAAYFDNTPPALKYINTIKDERRDYVAHELFNAEWAPMAFSEVATMLTEAKLSFVGDAAVANIFSNVLLADNIKLFLSEIKNPIFYESVRDYCVNQRFRKDVWVKGGIALTKLQKLQLLADMRFTLLFKPLDEPLIVPSHFGDMTIDEKIALPIIQALSQNNFSPKTITELLSYPALKDVNLAQACETMLVLSGCYVSPAYDDDVAEQNKIKTDKLNAYLIHEAQDVEHSSFLASPVTGGAIKVPRIHQLFLLAMHNGHTSPDAAVSFIWKVLSSRGHRMTKTGDTLCSTDDENIEAIARFASPFFETHVHLLRALKIL